MNFNSNSVKTIWIPTTGLHTQKAYTHTGTSSPQILLLSAHPYMHFAWELQLDANAYTMVYAYLIGLIAYMHEWPTKLRIGEYAWAGGKEFGVRTGWRRLIQIPQKETFHPEIFKISNHIQSLGLLYFPKFGGFLQCSQKISFQAVYIKRAIMDFNGNLLTRCCKTYLRAFLSWIAGMPKMLSAKQPGAPVFKEGGWADCDSKPSMALCSFLRMVPASYTLPLQTIPDPCSWSNEQIHWWCPDNN